MENSKSSLSSRRNSGTHCAIISKILSKRHAIPSGSKPSVLKSPERVSLLCGGKAGRGAGCQIALFLLKLAALESVRRISKSKCLPLWSGLQALHIFCYPPFKWIQKWSPFGMLVKGMQMLSRPLLVLSIATAFSGNSECINSTTESNGVHQGHDESYDASEFQQELSSSQSVTSLRDEGDLSVLPANRLSQLLKDLEDQGITWKDRIGEEELHRFYTAADGDFSRLLSSVRKTIQWRETYRILSGQELETWSTLVFWHGFDVKHKPLLIVRLGLACRSLPFSDRQHFGQAVVSQVYYGIMHLADRKNPQITVLVDCEGLSPFRLPMQMLKTCSSLLQTHFPNSLGCLFVIRLPSIIRVVAQTFVQVLKPITRQKLRFLGENYQKVLSESVETLPPYLGGNMDTKEEEREEEEEMLRTESDLNHEEEIPSSLSGDDAHPDQVLSMALMVFLVFGVFIYAYIHGVFGPETTSL